MKFLRFAKKEIVVLSTVITAPFALNAQQAIPLTEVLKHTGETVSVCGKVYSVALLKNVKSKPTLINVGGINPAERITVRIRFENRIDFAYKPEALFLNKNICFEGVVTKAHGYPEIILDSVNRDRLFYQATLAISDTTNSTDSISKSIVSTKKKNVIHQLPVNAYVLSGPDLDEPIITYLKAGSTVSIRYTDNGWSYVKVERDITQAGDSKPIYGFVRNLSVGINKKGEVLQKGGRFTALGNLLSKKQRSAPENMATASLKP